MKAGLPFLRHMMRVVPTGGFFSFLRQKESLGASAATQARLLSHVAFAILVRAE